VSWRRAPLYVEAHELAVWLGRHFDGERARTLDVELARTGDELLFQVARALAFPGAREQALLAADEAVLRLRVLARVACERARLAPRELRFAAARLERIGRMLGGWRRQRRLDAHARASTAEDTVEERRGARGTPGASSAAAPTGTTRGTAAPPTATGTTPTSTTTTTASASFSLRRSPNPRADPETERRPGRPASRLLSGGAGSSRARLRLPAAPGRAQGSGEAPSLPELP
jgi:hypothetical protein